MVTNCQRRLAARMERRKMHLPYLQPGKEALETRDLFLGLNHNLRPGPGQFYDMQNMSSDLSPVLSVRRQRGVLKTKAPVQALACRDSLCWVEDGCLLLNGQKTDLPLSREPGDNPKKLVSMGAYLIVLPDKKYINTVNPTDCGSMEAEVTTSGPVSLSQCLLDGTEISPEYQGPAEPQDPRDQSYWLDYDSKSLKQYEKSRDLWVVVDTPYVKLQYPGIGRGFSAYDGVEISGDPELEDLKGAAILYGCDENEIISPGLLKGKKTLASPVTVLRSVPLMDFCIESGNRLWGCRYGQNRTGAIVNEIYCSKLGDFKNWSCYLGISTDSYTVSLGSDGPFTGAVSHGGYPVFFKENCLHKIYGQMPSNFSVQTTPCRGVCPGCSESLAIVDEILYYKSRTGVCCYDGSLPREISQDLGPEPYGLAAAGGIHGKYYISMEKQGKYSLFVYDTIKNQWHREDSLQARFFCTCREDLYCVDEKGRLLSLLGTAGEKEDPAIPWMLEPGIIGVRLPGHKYLSRILLRMVLDPGSRVTVSVQYDSARPWESLGTVQGMNLRSFLYPVLPRRCDHLRLRLEGRGRAMIFSAARVLKPGSMKP